MEDHHMRDDHLGDQYLNEATEQLYEETVDSLKYMMDQRPLKGSENELRYMKF